MQNAEQSAEIDAGGKFFFGRFFIGRQIVEHENVGCQSAETERQNVVNVFKRKVSFGIHEVCARKRGRNADCKHAPKLLSDAYILFLTG